MARNDDDALVERLTSLCLLPEEDEDIEQAARRIAADLEDESSMDMVNKIPQGFVHRQTLKGLPRDQAMAEGFRLMYAIRLRFGDPEFFRSRDVRPMKDDQIRPSCRSYNLRVAKVKFWYCPTRPVRKRDSWVHEEICVGYDLPSIGIDGGYDFINIGFADEAEAQQWLEYYIERWKDDPPWFLVKSN